MVRLAFMMIIIIIIIYLTETLKHILHIIYTHTNIVWNC